VKLAALYKKNGIQGQKEYIFKRLHTTQLKIIEIFFTKKKLHVIEF
jgi:hypothetical protein